MSCIGIYNAYTARARAEEQDRLRKERIANIKEKNESNLRLRREAEKFHNESLDDAITGLLILSRYEGSYVEGFMIRAAFIEVEKCLRESLKRVPRQYTELSDALSYILKEASGVCDIIEAHKDSKDRYRYGSKRIENLVNSYNIKIKGEYLLPV